MAVRVTWYICFNWTPHPPKSKFLLGKSFKDGHRNHKQLSRSTFIYKHTLLCHTNSDVYVRLFDVYMC